MRRISHTPLLKIFTSLFLIIYTFVPPVLAVDDLYTVDNSQDVLNEGVSDPEWITQEPEEEIIVLSPALLPKLKSSSEKPTLESVTSTLLTYTPITDPITQPGKCVEDAAGKALNCTANDVSIANVTNVTILDDGCQSPADTVTFRATWDVESTSSERYDVGLYFATAGQISARTGACSVSTLPNTPIPPWYDYDSDSCGDISSSTTVHPQITLTVQCADPDGDNTLNVPYCTSWDNNAGGVCSGPSDAIPGTGSKCNCNNGFEVPITVPYEANIEVKKNLIPSIDEGNFNLSIDDSTQASCVGDNGATGKITVGAGTSKEPGDTHTVGENSTGCATDIDNYNTAISCVNRGTSTFHGGAPLTIASTGPLTVPVVKDDDIVCTITNTRKTGHLIVQKTTLPTGNQTEFSITASSTNGTVLNGATGTITDALDHDYQVTTGTYSVNEIVPTGWIQTTNTCVNIVVGENETKYCEITNTKLPTLTINKILLPASDTGLFNLKIDDTTYATNITDNGTTGPQIVNIGVHTFSEEAANSSTILSDYAVTYGGDTGCNTNGSISLAAGEHKTCTITNIALGKLTIVKDAVPNDSQDFNFTTTGNSLSNFVLDDDSDITLSNSKTFTHLLPGIYGVSETLITGWDLTNTSCSDQSSVNAIDISAGENITCTFTNTQRGTISGFKLNDPDGLLETTDGRTGVPGWTIELWKDGNKTAENITSATGFFSFENLIPGDYQLREVLVSGWIRIYPTDERLYVTLEPGENDENNNFINVKYPTITVYKNVDENGDGDLNDSIDIIGATDWTWDINGSGNYATGSTVDNKMPGIYTISEDQKTNYHVTSLVCGQTDYGAVESQSIALTSGQDLTCTFTNTRDTGTLRVVKILNNDNGGQLHKEDFSFTIDSGSPIYFESDGQNDFTKYAGLSYDISEISTPGYTTTYNNCEDVIVPKNGVATCTITNDDIVPSLTLVKTVTKDNGGTAVPTDWTLTATGPTTISGAGGVTSDSSFEAGTYTLSESTGPSGYAASSWSCTGVQNDGNTITLGLGDSAVCTITNDDIAPTLTVVKMVSNTHGGSKNIQDFPLFIDTTQVTSGVPNTVQANIEYTVSETNLPGYSAFNWQGDCSRDGKITLQPGDNKTCTITNYDEPGTLIVRKILVQNNGGNELYTDFSFQVNGGTVTAFEADGENQLTQNAGTYTITEPHVAGYETKYDNCKDVVLSNGETEICTITNEDIAPTITLNKLVTNNNGGIAGVNDFGLMIGDTGVTSGQTLPVIANVAIPLNETGLEGYSFVSITGDQECPAVLGGTVTLTEGQHISCTINNDDNIPHLTLIKNIESRHGGTAVPTDWTLTATGPTTISGAGGVTSDSSFNAGTYTLSESAGPSGYAASSWSCTGVENDENTITLGLGDSAVCTITNSDIQAKLTVIKHVENNNGGNAEAEDFTMLVTGVNATNTSFAGSETGTVVGLDAGAYSVDESSYFGYSKTLGTDCSGTIAIGEEKTCIITNDDIAPTLKLTKIVTNDDGGIKTSTDWTLYAQGSELSFSDLGDSTTFHNVKAGVTYSLSESATPTGYTSSWWTCTGGGEASGNTVKLGVGENVTCTIANDDIAPTLRLIKHVVNNNGGNAVASDWDLTATGTDRGFTGKGDSTTAHTVKAGVEYTLTESSISGYIATNLSCTGGSLSENKLTLGLDEDVVCTVTNDDVAPTITLIKNVVKDHGGNASVNDFGLTIGDTSVASGQTLPVNANTSIVINETGLPGYQFISITGDGCPSNLGDTVTLNEGQNLVCTITNDDMQPTLTIVKNVINNTNDRGLSAKDFTITVAGTEVSNPSFAGSETGTTVGLDAGTYSVSETYDPTQYTQQLSTDCNGAITLGEHKTCTITNTDINNIPAIDVEKIASTHTLPENGGNVTYTFTVENTGSETVRITSLTDDKFGTLLGDSDCQVGTILAGLSQCSFDLTETLSGNAGTTHVNEFTTYAEDDEKTSVSDNDNEIITFTDVLPSISVNKVANINEIPETGGDVTYTFTVTNNTIEPVIITSLSDNVIGDHIGDTDCYEGMTLSGNASCTFDETYTIPAGIAPATHANIFTALAHDDEGNPASDSDDEVITLTYVPTLKLIKSVVNQYESEGFSSDWTLYATGETNSFYVAGNEGQYHVVTPNITYTLSENGPDGFEASEWSCTGGTLVDNNITLAPEDDVTCTITNTGLPGTINIYKDVINSDLVGEDVYADTIFNVNLNGDLTDIKLISDTQANPQVATYENLDAGQYTINEDPTDGYLFLSCHEEEQLRDNNLGEELPNTFYVANGETLNIICRNLVLDPVLNIAKINDTGGAGMLAGESVLYTLTITAPTTEPEEEYILKNVLVTDILPAGFTYQTGTWTATSSIRGDIKGIVTTEPVYGSNPALWNLGDMVEGESVILTYIAKISTTQDPGTYKDIAWTQGTSLVGSKILGNINMGIFVGTEVKVIAPVEEGDVLGITDYVTLPNTGADTLLTIGAIALAILGLLVLIFNSKKALKLLAVIFIICAGLTVLSRPTKTYAQVSNLVVKIEQPASQINSANFEIGYVALDLLSRPLQIQCYESVHGAFGPVYTTNNGNCVINNTVVTTDGTYEFYVTATAGSETVSSEKVSVIVDLTKPSPVTNYEKTTNGCINTLKFTTANDGGQTSKIQIFRSDKSSFSANSSNLIAEIPTTSGQLITYQDTTPLCDTTYFYAIRALDAAGNISTFVTDKIVVVTILPAELTEQGEIESEETAPEETTPSTPSESTTDNSTEVIDDNTNQTDTSGEVKGETSQDTQTKNIWSWLTYVLVGVGLLVIVGIGYIYAKNRRTGKY